MPGDNADLVRQIHASGRRLVVAATGGGSLAISRLLTVPGASRSVLEAIVPYCEPALTRFLGGQPDQFCSPPTALAMAMAAYRRALEMTDSPAMALGVACTAGLVTDRPKHGPHRLHAAAQTRAATWLASLELEKGRRTRDEEENLVADVLLNLVAECCGLSVRLPLVLADTERLERSHIEAPESWQALLAGEIDSLRIHPAGQPAPPPKLLFPGAFHPLHEGHRGMATIASQLLGGPVEFEITIINADKPALDYLEIDSRIQQFAADQPLWLSRAPTFVEKSLLFPGVTFVVGTDTIERIAEVRFYGNDPRALDRAIEVLDQQGCRFLVFGRSTRGTFRTLGQLNLPPSLARLCREVPPEQFRVDVSSSALRLPAKPSEP
jgi:nicotinamide mononucleotide (NMN) deamidase PncC